MDPVRRNCQIEIEERAEKGAEIRAKLSTPTPVREFDPDLGRIVPTVLVPTGYRADADQLPLLDSHDRFSIDSLLGSIRNIGIEGTGVIGELHFEPGGAGQSARAKVEGGHLTDVSVGFVPEKKSYVPPNEKKRIGSRTFNAGPDGLNVVTEWRAKEASLTPIGADHAAKVMRAWEESQTNQPKPKMETAEETRAITTGNEDARSDSARAEENREKEIRAIAERYDIDPSDADIAVTGGDSVAAFLEHTNAVLKERQEKKKKADALKDMGQSMFNRHETGAYSLNRAIEAMAGITHPGRQGIDAVEGVMREAHDQLARSFKEATGQAPGPKSLLIPADIFSRTLNTGTDTAGGHLVPVEHRSIIEYCREMMVMGRVGATFLTGLSGDLKFPTHTNELTATWPGETGATTPEDLTFGEMTMSPERVTHETSYSLMLMHQSSEDIESMTRREIASAIGYGIDRAALYGTGTNQPLGLLNESGTTPITFGTGDATWAKVVEFDRLLEETNCPGTDNTNALAWLTTSKVKEHWLTVEKFSGTGKTLAESDPGWQSGTPAGTFNMPTANGARIVHTNNAGLGDKVIKGAWAQMLIGLWGSLELIVDPFTLASTGSTRVVASAFADVGNRHPESFVISTDKGDGTNV